VVLTVIFVLFKHLEDRRRVRRVDERHGFRCRVEEQVTVIVSKEWNEMALDLAALVQHRRLGVHFAVRCGGSSTRAHDERAVDRIAGKATSVEIVAGCTHK